MVWECLCHPQALRRKKLKRKRNDFISYYIALNIFNINHIISYTTFIFNFYGFRQKQKTTLAYDSYVTYPSRLKWKSLYYSGKSIFKFI